jgi:D-xylose transport system substrate-binding protein
MRGRRRRLLAAAAATLGVAGGLAAVTVVGSSSTGSSASAASTIKIALLLPESKTARYEAQDRPLFTKKVKALCPNCQIVYSNAGQDSSKQQNQGDAALSQGIKAMVLDPVDSKSAAVIVNKAGKQKVPVISYDRLLVNSKPAYYISYDNQQVGKLQAQSLVAKLKAMGKTKGSIVMINGDPTDNNAGLFKKGAHSVLDKSGYKIAKEYDTPTWSADKAQNEMQQAITALGNNGFVGVYAANDGTAGGAIAAMKGAGIKPSTRPVTGQDAELAGIQRIVAGEQYMTVFKAYKPEAETAATVAVALAQGKKVPSRLISGKTNNGSINVPSKILKPLAVIRSRIRSTVIKDRLVTVKQVCTKAYAKACKSLGLTK